MDLDNLTFRQIQDPQVWSQLRQKRPFCYVPELDLWLVARHADVEYLLNNASNEETLRPVRPLCAEAGEIAGNLRDVVAVTAAGDPPDYLRYREALVATFPYRRWQVAPWMPSIVRRTAEMITQLREKGGIVDLVDEFAAPISLNVIADVLGIPDDPKLRREIKAQADGQIAGVWGDPTPQEQIKTMSGLVSWWKYSKRFVAGDLPEESFTAALRRWRDSENEGLSPLEIASFVFNIMVAGYETTRSLIVASQLQALSHPRYMAILCEGGPDVARFIDAVNVYDSPISGWLRKLREPYCGMPAGARVLLLIGSANRDFEGGDEFRLERPPVKSLAFGATAHHCIGISMARAEASHAVSELAANFSAMRLASGFVRENANNVGFRAMKRLPVHLS